MVKESGTLDWLDDLNAEQRAAVTFGEGPLLVVAGAGSGKTRTLAYRVAYLLQQGVDPHRILLLTFTRRSAQEMIRRASAVASRSTRKAERVWGGTFHSMANRLLRMYARPLGLRNDFTVLDQSDAEDLLSLIRHELGFISSERRFPRKSTCLAIYSRTVNGVESLETVLERQFPWCSEWENELRTVFSRYVARKQERNVLDYDDLLLYWSKLVSSEAMAREVGGKFDHVLVDEYQDTNPLQAQILRGMRLASPNVMVVGDDAQSIYGFRAATVRNMLDFPKEFPGTTIIKLEQNYRSTEPILETTNRLISEAKEQYSKELHSTRGPGTLPKLVTCEDEVEQNKYVIERVLEHFEQGIPLRKQAVLFRASHLSATLEVELSRRNIPYHKYGGLRFLEAAHIKDLLAVLRILENPRDEMAWFRIVQLFDGIGPATAARVLNHVADCGYDPRAVRSFKSPPAGKTQMTAFADLLDDLVGTKRMPPASQVERVRTFYEPLLKKIYENPTVRARDLRTLEQIASGYESRQKFLVDIQLDPPTSTSDLAGPPMLDEDWLNLSTIHSAKGCEWDAVYLIHATDGFLPSDMACGSSEEIEEERRLTYVAMTRARDFLYVVRPLRYYHTWTSFTDRHTYAQLCRFLTPHVVETMEEDSLIVEAKDDGVASTLLADRDIGAEMRSMWDAPAPPTTEDFAAPPDEEWGAPPPDEDLLQ